MTRTIGRGGLPSRQRASRGTLTCLCEASPDPDHRSVAAEALGDIQAEEAVTPLLRLLDASDSDVRSAAARALSKIWFH